MNNPYKKKLLKTIESFGMTYSVWDVFSDFVELGALSVANSVDKRPEVWDKREKQYLNIMDKYTPDEQKLFPVMYADLVAALDYEISLRGAPADVLGALFHDLELHNKYKGQFFTPQHVSDLMGAMTFANGADILKATPHKSRGGAFRLIFAAILRFSLKYCRYSCVKTPHIA